MISNADIFPKLPAKEKHEPPKLRPAALLASSLLVVENPDPNRLSGHARITFDLLTEAQLISFWDRMGFQCSKMAGAICMSGEG